MRQPSPATRNSLPRLLARSQVWLESERLLRKVLPVRDDQPIRIIRIRRNFKFRKITVAVNKTAGDQRYICYVHYWPRGLRNLAWFSEQAGLAGVAVPQPLSIHTRWQDLIRQRAFSLVLPYIEGEHLSADSKAIHMATLGQNLGRLHGISGERWGPLLSNFPRRGTHWAGLQRYWRRSTDQLQNHARFAGEQDIHNVMAWLREHGQFLGNYKHLNLTHGDPASGNILIQPDGTLRIIDCDRISFEPGPLELANALLQSYCRHDKQRRQLTEAYLQSCPPEAAEAWQQHAQFFLVAALFWRCQRKLQWARKRPDTGRSLARAEQAWQQLGIMLAGHTSTWQAAVQRLDQPLS